MKNRDDCSKNIADLYWANGNPWGKSGTPSTVKLGSATSGLERSGDPETAIKDWVLDRKVESGCLWDNVGLG